MNNAQDLSTETKLKELREALLQPMTTLRNNLSKVPLGVLKTKYKQGYDALILKLQNAASDYALLLVFHNIRVPRDSLEECTQAMNQLIRDTGVLKRLSHAVYKTQDIDAFEQEAFAMRRIVLKELAARYDEQVISIDEARHPLVELQLNIQKKVG